MLTKAGEKLLLVVGLLARLFPIDIHDLVEPLFGKAQPFPDQLFVGRHPAQGAFDTAAAATAAFHDPFERAHVFTVPGPDKLALLVFAEPVDPEDERWGGHALAPDLKPVLPIIVHVIAAKRQHRHRIAAHGRLSRGRCGRFGPHSRREVYTMLPVVGLEHQGKVLADPPAKDEGADRHTTRVLPVGIDGGTLACGGCETGIRMRRWGTASGGPIVTLPIDEVFWGFLGHAFPPDIAIVGQGYIGED